MASCNKKIVKVSFNSTVSKELWIRTRNRQMDEQHDPNIPPAF